MKKGDEQFRVLFEQSTDGIFIANKQGRYTDVNPAGCKMLGYTKDEITKLSIVDVITADEVVRVAPDIEILLREGTIKNHWKFKRKDQTVFVGEVTATKLSDGRLQATLSNVTEQMLGKEVIIKSEERSRITLDHMLEGCQIIGFDWRYLYVNHAAEIQNRRPNEELLGNRFMDMWPGIEETEVFEVIQQTLEQRISQHLEINFKFPDGGMGWFNLSIQPVPEGVFILSVDITENKMAEEALRVSEEGYRNIYESAVVGIYRTTPEGQILMANSTLVKMLGFGSFEELAQRDLEKEGFEKKKQRKEFRKKIEKEGRIIGLEAVWKTKEGKSVFVNENARAFYDHNGKIIYYEGTIEDITERKHSEEALRESEERYRSIFENSSVAIILSSPDGRILSANEYACKLFERSKEEMNQADRASIIDMTDSRLPGILEERKRTGSVKGELTFIKKDGTHFQGEISSVIFKDSEGNERTSMVLRDLTAKKKIEEEIKNLNLLLEQRVIERTVQLEAANKELEAFSYSVSHDLRAPLRHINGFVDLLTEKYQDLLPEKGKHYLGIIINASLQMGTLIDDLLQFSRTGRQEMQQSDLDMNIVLQEVMKLIAHDIQDRNIKWEIAELPSLSGDHALLRMVWYNLLHNAVKFSKAKDPAIIQVGFLEEGNDYVFFVRDNGAGFDMKYAHKLFGVFQRLHSKEEFEGTGIGLANVHRIILKHQGRTWAESQLDKGASFYFTIPINKEKV